MWPACVARCGQRTPSVRWHRLLLRTGPAVRRSERRGASHPPGLRVRLLGLGAAVEIAETDT
jgi:hypothetical protein